MEPLQNGRTHSYKSSFSLAKVFPVRFASEDAVVMGSDIDINDEALSITGNI